MAVYTESFETSLGDWVNATGHVADWQRHTGATGSGNTGPDTAHDGSYYIYVETSNGGANAYLDESIIEYDIGEPSQGDIDFWYHQYGGDQGILSLEAYFNGVWTELWRSFQDRGNQWNNVNIPFEGKSKLRFKNIAAGGYGGDVALDLLVVTHNPMPDINVVESFETGYGDWENDPTNKSDWIRKSGATGSSNTGPSSAYDGSYYIYVETSSGSSYNDGDTDSLVYDMGGVTDGSISFWYHQYGTEQGTLYLEGLDNTDTWQTIWSSTGDQGTSWLSHSENFTGYSKIRFKNVAVGGFYGDVALDLLDLTYQEVAGGGDTGGGEPIDPKVFVKVSGVWKQVPDVVVKTV